MKALHNRLDRIAWSTRWRTRTPCIGEVQAGVQALPEQQNRMKALQKPPRRTRTP